MKNNSVQHQTHWPRPHTLIGVSTGRSDFEVIQDIAIKATTTHENSFINYTRICPFTFNDGTEITHPPQVDEA